MEIRAVVLAAALLTASCSSSADSSKPTAQGGVTTASQPGDGQGDRATSQPGSGSDVGAPTTGALSSTIPTTGANGPGGSGDSKAGKGADGKLPPPGLPANQDVVPIHATVTPACVKRGGTASFGAGYGGNDKGFASDQGTYSASWVVSPTAPTGRGRVDVVVGYRGEFGYDGPHFAVADDHGNCPEAWIDGKDR
jgi:hypothetical protein